jgi:hypothetical protein
MIRQKSSHPPSIYPLRHSFTLNSTTPQLVSSIFLKPWQALYYPVYFQHHYSSSIPVFLLSLVFPCPLPLPSLSLLSIYSTINPHHPISSSPSPPLPSPHNRPLPPNHQTLNTKNTIIPLPLPYYQKTRRQIHIHLEMPPSRRKKSKEKQEKQKQARYTSTQLILFEI